jgi:glycosyltransferase involved in cell wall biosynthesis
VVLYPALAAQRRGAKLIMDLCDWFGRGGSVEERPNGLVRAMLRPLETFFEEHYRTRADGTLAINAFLRKRAIDLGVKPECTEVIRNGAVTHIAPTDRLAARREFGLPLEAPTIGYVGNIYTRDAELMAAAFDRVRRAMPDARLLLVGYFNRRIETWLEDAASVIRTGAVTFEQVYAYLSACDVCWLPLRDSGANRGRWPGKLNDYMTVGRAVVATAVGDLAEVIPQYRIGVVTRDDADEFARQTVELLHDARRREQMGKQARHAAEGDWSWARKTDTLENFYRRVLQTC